MVGIVIPHYIRNGQAGAMLPVGNVKFADRSAIAVLHYPSDAPARPHTSVAGASEREVQTSSGTTLHQPRSR
jgi:hypothetical protein